MAHDATLAPYPTRPEHVPLEHCRLCMWSAPPDTETSQRSVETVGPLEPSAASQVWGLSSALAAHLQEAHELSPTEYRAAVNRQVVAQWPEPVSPATLRACVAAYKAGLSDAEYGLGVCACCAREKRRCKLAKVHFAASTVAYAPSWLGCLSADEWLLHREVWYDQWDRLLNVEKYLQRV